MDEFLARGQIVDRGSQYAFNSEQLASETAHLGARLAESESMLPHRAGKRGVRGNDTKILKCARVR